MTAAQTAALKARQLKVDQNAFDTNEFLLRYVPCHFRHADIC